jgi:hypothetical protein
LMTWRRLRGAGRLGFLSKEARRFGGSVRTPRGPAEAEPTRGGRRGRGTWCEQAAIRARARIEAISIAVLISSLSGRQDSVPALIRICLRCFRLPCSLRLRNDLLPLIFAPLHLLSRRSHPWRIPSLSMKSRSRRRRSGRRRTSWLSQVSPRVPPRRHASTASWRGGSFPPQGESHWRVPPRGCTTPAPEEGEVVVFVSFFESGLGLPAHPFLRGLLNHYKVELHHLNPNGVRQIAAFVTFCEAFLGVEPNFVLWKHFFHARVTMDHGVPLFAGGCGIQLRNGRVKQYFRAKMTDSNKGWHSEWFYVSNPPPSLPKFSGHFAQRSDEWEWATGKEEKKTWVNPMLAELKRLKDAGLTGVRVLWTFFERRIQPLKARAHPMYRYAGVSDPTRSSRDELTPVEVRARVWAMIKRSKEVADDVAELDRHQAGLALEPAARHEGLDPPVVSLPFFQVFSFFATFFVTTRFVFPLAAPPEAVLPTLAGGRGLAGRQSGGERAPAGPE